MNADARGPHVVLVGMMGAGKTTVGRHLARRLQWPFLDTDREVERRTGRRVAEIFAEDGEPAFRALESAVVADLAAESEPKVIAAAGGAVLDPVNRAALRRAGIVVWLVAPLGTLLDRTARGTHRPALSEDPAGTLTTMITDRTPLYEELADLTVDSAEPVEVVIEAVIDQLARRGMSPESKGSAS